MKKEKDFEKRIEILEKNQKDLMGIINDLKKENSSLKKTISLKPLPIKLESKELITEKNIEKILNNALQRKKYEICPRPLIASLGILINLIIAFFLFQVSGVKEVELLTPSIFMALATPFSYMIIQLLLNIDMEYKLLKKYNLNKEIIYKRNKFHIKGDPKEFLKKIENSVFQVEYTTKKIEDKSS